MMTDPLDSQQDDYNDCQKGPLPKDLLPTDRRARWTPLKFWFAVGCVFGLFALFLAGMEMLGSRIMTGGENRMLSANNLKQIGLAFHNYNDTWNELPHNTFTPDGRPLLSWRVHILPFIEEGALYAQFHLDEPWDSPHNFPLLKRMPVTYGRPQDRGKGLGTLTCYRGFSSPGTIFEFRPSHVRRDPVPVIGRLKDPRTMFSLGNIKDGMASTILVVEAGDPIEWTKPDDLDASLDKPFPKMGGYARKSNYFQVLLCDGSVRGVKPSVSEATLRAAVTHSGGDMLGSDWDQ